MDGDRSMSTPRGARWRRWAFVVALPLLLAAVVHMHTAFAQTGRPGGFQLPPGIDPSMLPRGLEATIQQLQQQQQGQPAPELRPQQTIESPLATMVQPPQRSLLEEEYSRRAGQEMKQIGYDLFG